MKNASCPNAIAFYILRRHEVSNSNQYGPSKVPMIKDTLLRANRVLILPQLSRYLGNGLERYYEGCMLVSIYQRVRGGQICNRGSIAPLDICWPPHVSRHFPIDWKSRSCQALSEVRVTVHDDKRKPRLDTVFATLTKAMTKAGKNTSNSFGPDHEC